MFKDLVDRREWLSWASASFCKAIYGVKSLEDKRARALCYAPPKKVWVGVATCDVNVVCLVVDDLYLVSGYVGVARKIDE